MTLRRSIADLAAALGRLGPEHEAALAALVTDVLAAWEGGGKLLICGNGGSAADSQHLAAELVGRYQAERPGWAAVALTVDTSTLTAVANDYGFDRVFARQVEALGRPGDVLLVISTSGASANGVEAVTVARRLGLRSHGLLGKGGGPLWDLVDSAFVVPCDDTPRIQEIHGLVIHALCEALEEARLGADRPGALDG